MTRNTVKGMFLVSPFLLALAFGHARAQKADLKAVVVPDDVYPLAILSQPTCPLKIERVVLLRYLDGSFGKRYRLRNEGRKPINEYTLVIWNSDNTGDVITWRADNSTGPLKPNQSVPSGAVESPETVPLTAELRSKLELNVPMKKVVFFFILQTKDSDGIEYDSGSLFDELKKHLKQVHVVNEADH